MGKRLITQRRGRGTPRYRTPAHRFLGAVKYDRSLGYGESIGGQVIEFTRDPAHSAPLAKILLEDFTETIVIANEGLWMGDWIKFGEDAEISAGNVMPLGNITEGTFIYNVERRPKDGGKLIRSGGSSGIVVSHDKAKETTYIKLPSKRTISVKSNCRATIGKIAGGGKRDKPMNKAGQMFHAKKAKGKLYPTVGGTSMNAIDHPHGGGRHPHIGKPSTVSRNTPAGRKVGHIAAKRTGLKKRG